MRVEVKLNGATTSHTNCL